MRKAVERRSEEKHSVNSYASSHASSLYSYIHITYLHLQLIEWMNCCVGIFPCMSLCKVAYGGLSSSHRKHIKQTFRLTAMRTSWCKVWRTCGSTKQFRFFIQRFSLHLPTFTSTLFPVLYFCRDCLTRRAIYGSLAICREYDWFFFFQFSFHLFP